MATNKYENLRFIKKETLTGMAEAIREKNTDIGELTATEMVETVKNYTVEDTKYAAAAADIAKGKIAYVNNQKFTGTHTCDQLPAGVTAGDLNYKSSDGSNITATFTISAQDGTSTGNVALAQGPTTLQESAIDLAGKDADGYDVLRKENIKDGVTIFGVKGTFTDFPLTGYRDEETGEDFYPISEGSVLKNRIGYINGEKITGTMEECDGNDLAMYKVQHADGYYGIQTEIVNEGYFGPDVTNELYDENFKEENIRYDAEGLEIFGVTGTFTKCDQDIGATAKDILPGKKAWVNGQEVVGAMEEACMEMYAEDNLDKIKDGILPVYLNIEDDGFVKNDESDHEQTLEVKLSDIDDKFDAANIKDNVTIFGVEGKFTEDANAESQHILTGYNAYVKGEEVKGEIAIVYPADITFNNDGQMKVNGGAKRNWYFDYNSSSTSPADKMMPYAPASGSLQINNTSVDAGIDNGNLYVHLTPSTPGWITSTEKKVTVHDDAFKASNIKAGETIFGVDGTYAPNLPKPFDIKAVESTYLFSGGFAYDILDADETESNGDFVEKYEIRPGSFEIPKTRYSHTDQYGIERSVSRAMLSNDDKDWREKLLTMQPDQDTEFTIYPKGSYAFDYSATSTTIQIPPSWVPEHLPEAGDSNYEVYLGDAGLDSYSTAPITITFIDPNLNKGFAGVNYTDYLIFHDHVTCNNLASPYNGFPPVGQTAVQTHNYMRYQSDAFVRVPHMSRQKDANTYWYYAKNIFTGVPEVKIVLPYTFCGTKYDDGTKNPNKVVLIPSYCGPGQESAEWPNYPGYSDAVIDAPYQAPQDWIEIPPK